MRVVTEQTLYKTSYRKHMKEACLSRWLANGHVFSYLGHLHDNTICRRGIVYNIFQTNRPRGQVNRTL